LARFDGLKFTVYDSGNSPGLKRNRILSLYEDRAGTLWIGTDQGGLSRYSEGRFTTFTTGDGLPDNYVTSIAEDREGNLWVGTSNGLARLTAGRFTIFTARDGLTDNQIPLIRAGRDGGLWIVTGLGLTHWRAGNMKTYPLPRSLSTTGVFCVHGQCMKVATEVCGSPFCGS
jgi:ligand-binding sensor domain-containing protein